MTSTRVWALALALGAAPSQVGSEPAPALAAHAFTLAEPAEVVATIEAACDGCAWGRAGREAAVLRLTLDGGYSQHLVLVRGETQAAYRVALGALAQGRHTLSAELDRGWTPPAVGAARVTRLAIEAVPASDPRHAELAHAPVLCVRPNALGRFTDVPLVAWVEADARPQGRRLRYSVVFSNEDGGTPADRLLATWGRLTDIEFVYSVELDAAGGASRAEYQGKDHEIRAFAGRREGLHPVLHVVTDNNMLSDAGECGARFAPAPRPQALEGTSREAVMDAEPWTYHVSSEEARREGRVAADGARADGQIADPRRYAYLEACAATEDVGLTFSVGVAGPDGVVFHASDGGRGKFLILRSADHFPNGCFRGAVALPEGTPASAIRALRFRARTRPARKGEPPLAPGTGSARLLRVNKLFVFGAGDTPGESLFSWEGELPIAPEGAEVELKLGG